MKKYFSFFRIRFSNTLQYRTAAWAGVCTQFAWEFMKLLMFKAFYESDPSAFPMEFSQLSSYIWLYQAFLAFFAFWFFDNDVFATITNGDLAYELARPMDLYNMWMTKNLASRSAKAVLRAVPILIIAAFLPEPFNIGLPPNIGTFLLFFFSLVMGLLLVVSACMLIYIATIHTMSSLGLRLFVIAIAEILSGAVIPLPFFPDNIRVVVELLPFASMNNLPLRIYSGNIVGDEAAFFVVVQIFWFIVLQLWGRLAMRGSLKKVVVQGG